MPKCSAGLMMYRVRESWLEVFLVHPGGPFWANKDKGAWSIPKGEYAGEEEAFEVAKREFHEETGFVAEGSFVELGSIKQSGGKIVKAWAFEGDCDAERLESNRTHIEWPPRSGHQLEVPEVDRGGWFSIAAAREHLLKSQEPLLDKLCATLPLVQ
jgi:predicted NUDIX family NTP pyrophosphohydrolase